MSTLQSIIAYIEANGITDLQKARYLIATDGAVAVKLIPGLAGAEAEALKVLDFCLSAGPGLLKALALIESFLPAPKAAGG